MNAMKQAATDLAGSINLTLGWRAADPEFDLSRIRYTGGVVLGPRGAQEVVRLLGRMEAVEGIMCETAPLAIAVGLAFRYREELRRLREDAPPYARTGSALLRADLEQFMALETLVIPPNL